MSPTEEHCQCFVCIAWRAGVQAGRQLALTNEATPSEFPKTEAQTNNGQVHCRVVNLDGDVAEIRIGGARFSFPYAEWDRASRFVEHVERLVNRIETPQVLPKGTRVRIMNGGGRGVVHKAFYVLESDHGGLMHEALDNVRPLDD